MALGHLFSLYSKAMPLSFSFAFVAVDAFLIEVECLLGNRFPAEHVNGALAADFAHLFREFRVFENLVKFVCKVRLEGLRICRFKVPSGRPSDLPVQSSSRTRP